MLSAEFAFFLSVVFETVALTFQLDGSVPVETVPVAF